MEHQSNCDSYDDETQDIPADDIKSNSSTSEVEITDSNSDNSVDIKFHNGWK
jgi:hypothetical protein